MSVSLYVPAAIRMVSPLLHAFNAPETVGYAHPLLQTSNVAAIPVPVAVAVRNAKRIKIRMNIGNRPFSFITFLHLLLKTYVEPLCLRVNAMSCLAMSCLMFQDMKTQLILCILENLTLDIL